MTDYGSREAIPAWKRATRADFDAETAALVRRDADRRRFVERHGEPVRDPHVVVFADGCASWLTYRNLPEAQRYYDRLVAEDPDRWAGTTLAPKTDDLPRYDRCPNRHTGDPQ